MEITIFGPGCPKCKTMEKNAQQAVEELGLDATVTKVEDLDVMAEHGVMITPALAIDGDLVISGRVASPNQITKMIEDRT